jgi:hypothetical protein
MAAPLNLAGMHSGAARLFRIRKTCFALLRKRGYNVPEDEAAMDSETFGERFGADPSREVAVNSTLPVCASKEYLTLSRSTVLKIHVFLSLLRSCRM